MDTGANKKPRLSSLDKTPNNINENDSVALADVKTPSSKRKISAVTPGSASSSLPPRDKPEAALERKRRAVDKHGATNNDRSEVMQFLRAQKAEKRKQEEKKAAQGLINGAMRAMKSNFSRTKPITLFGGIDSRILLFEDLLVLAEGTHVNIFVSKEYNYVELNEEMKAIGPSLVKTKVGKVWYTVLSAEVIDNKCSDMEKIHKEKLSSDVWGNGNESVGLKLPLTGTSFFFQVKHALLRPNDVKFFGYVEQKRNFGEAFSKIQNNDSRVAILQELQTTRRGSWVQKHDFRSRPCLHKRATKA